MTFLIRTTVAGACTLAVLASGPTASAATWQRAYLEPAIHAWMGVVTFLAADGEREDEDDDCEGECEKGDGCKKCDRKKGHGEWHRDHMKHHEPREGHKGPPHGHMGPHHGPRGDVISLLHDMSARLGRIERMLASRGPDGPQMGPPHHHGPHGGRPEMHGPRPEMHKRMSEMRQKWEDASPEERAEMKAKFEAKMKEGRARMEAARQKWEEASPEERAEMKKKWEARKQEARERSRDGDKSGERAEQRPMVEAARQRTAELENRIKRLEAELERVKEALKASES